MDESKAKEFIEQWFEGDQIRSEFDYQVSDSIGLEEALKNLDTNISPSKPNPIVHKTAETNSSEEVSTSTAEDTPKLQFILPDPTFRNVMKWVKDQQIEVLSAPQVTTLSGRQAQIAVTQEISIVSGLETSEGKTTYTTQQVPYGLSIDMIPVVNRTSVVESHNPTLDLTLVVQFSEFLGYDDPAAISKAVPSDSDKAAKFQIPLPRSRKRTLTTKVEVPDGAALLIGSLPATNSILFKSKVPMLGDLPFVGKLFRHEGSQEVRKMRFIIVQPTIMDSGNQ
jgi:type II secretory pathway component HofQ